MAILAMTVANVAPSIFGSKGRRPSLEDFLPQRRPMTTQPFIRPRQTQAQIKNVFMTLASAAGATIRQPHAS